MNYSDSTYEYWQELYLDFTDNIDLYNLADYRSELWQQFFKRIDGQLTAGIDLLLNNLRPHHQVPGKDIALLMDMLALLARPNTKLTNKQKLKATITMIKNWQEVMVPSQKHALVFAQW